MAARWSGIAMLGAWVALATAGMAHAQMEAPNLKAAPPNTTVTAVTYCKARAEYHLTYKDGTHRGWPEFSIALKIDGTDKEPPPGMAVALPSGRVGDRILLVFASLDDLKQMVRPGC